MKEVLDFLSANRPFYLATVKGDIPRLRPLGFLMESGGRIWFGVGTQKDVYAQLVKNPKAEISSTDSEGQNWVRLYGQAVFDDSPALFQAAVAVMPALAEYYPKGGPSLGLFYLRDGQADFYDIRGQITKSVKL